MIGKVVDMGRGERKRKAPYESLPLFKHSALVATRVMQGWSRELPPQS